MAPLVLAMLFFKFLKKGGLSSFVGNTIFLYTTNKLLITWTTGDSLKTSLKLFDTKVQGHADKLFWRIEMKDVLKPGETAVVDVETVYTLQLIPHPASITQKDKQLVLYNGNHYFYSPYPVKEQSTIVNLGTRNVESYTKLKPSSQSENIITYGSYEDVPPFSVDKMSVHYENNAPFLTITNLERVIEVSHWGNIAVEETIDLKHSGATLKGPFSRYEYQRETQSGLSSVRSFKTILPAAAADIYYRDEIGNISTSNMKILSDSVELDLRPRFPLFGGWKTHYVIGYNVPSYEYLFNRGDDYLLKMRFLDHVFDDMIVDEVTTKIILPEGSQNMQLTTPYPIEHLPNSLHFTYLDIKGRPVIILRKKNLVENHIQDFQLQYNFPRILMLQEPFLIVAAFYLLFVFVIVYVRLDFSITKDEVGESRMRVAGYCEKVLAHQDKRALTYTYYNEQLGKLKSSKDINAFLTSVKNINHEYKRETAHIADLLVKLKADAPDLAEKVSELQKADKHLKELYTQHQSLYVDKLVPGKIARQAFVDTENQFNKKKEECVEKINTLVKSLQ
ncbi:dolichyl-diphosphooligosaccharide--protein glycosyltransferase subunit 1 isoform X2 [Zootermopsis nevadensis]|uniref:dolichyl-diphosphooligosaccharide--protein glycosyltransferase subunit 1 isoform X2 n=1 Tax=Zootermopsis nevadensis TaxID=136037 RepID=UPI000B8E3EBF|nr:dolichyl-diphosphooligosaccharide--protein glycosyltransferase subunit 1 isoform X2 [Zootermopsis nevadensis]